MPFWNKYNILAFIPRTLSYFSICSEPGQERRMLLCVCIWSHRDQTHTLCDWCCVVPLRWPFHKGLLSQLLQLAPAQAVSSFGDHIRCKEHSHQQPCPFLGKPHPITDWFRGIKSCPILLGHSMDILNLELPESQKRSSFVSHSLTSSIAHKCFLSHCSVAAVTESSP